MSLDPQIRHQADDEGHTEITLKLPAEWAAVFNDMDLWNTADKMHTALVAVAWARLEDQGKLAPRPKSDWAGLLMDLERLTGRLDATKAAVIRKHRAAGGSLNDLATAMDVPRSTAQDARTRAMDSDRYAYTGWVAGEHDRGTTHMRIADGLAEQDAAAARRATATDSE